MLATKDVLGYLAPLAPHVARLVGRRRPRHRGRRCRPRPPPAPPAPSASTPERPDPATAIAMLDLGAGDRLLICGSLYLAGFVLRDNG